AGGSIEHSFEDSVKGVRLIDGRGQVHEIMKDEDPRFWAMFGNLGLLGVVSQVIFECVPTFQITGHESATGIDDCEVDLFGDRGGMSLEQFLKEKEFARIEWWPQRGVERVVVWQAARPDDMGIASMFPAHKRFGDRPELQQAMLCF